MNFFQVAGVVLFIIGLSLASFLFGLYVANAYHRQADRKVQKSVMSYQETMKENFALSESQRHWNAHYLPARDIPFADGDYQSTVRRIAN